MGCENAHFFLFLLSEMAAHASHERVVFLFVSVFGDVQKEINSSKATD
jgi:hypothetical protein